MRESLSLMLPALLLAAACGDQRLAPAPRFWSMANLQESSHQGRQSLPCSNPAGLPCNYFVDQSADGSHDVLQFKLAFSEGKPMAYMTTDFWDNTDRIWLQPMYFLVTEWNAKPPLANRLLNDDATPVGPIFSIGPASAFYSPYWQVVYVEVPPGTPATKYTSARQLFDDRLVMHPGPNRFASIGPADLTVPAVDDIKRLFPDIGRYLVSGEGDLGQVAASAQGLTGWLDGSLIWYVDFGIDNFDADANRVVQDIPLFLFVTPDATGKLNPLGAPNVGGVAPLFSGQPARVSATHRPRFGALWRLYFATVPSTAGMFFLDQAEALVAGGGDPLAILPMVRRVALDQACFGSVASLGGCVWLDSQYAIESRLGPHAITRTALQPACPFVMFAGYPVPAQ